MLDKIDSNDITVQVETSSSDRVVPDGIALSKGTFDLGTTDGGTFTAMGMNKSGNQTGLGTGWVTVTGWTANSGFPGTVITSNALVVAQAAQVQVVFRARFGSGLWVSKVKSAMRILQNGSIIKESSGDDLNMMSVVANAAAGDTFSVQVRMTSWPSLQNYLNASDTSLTVKQNSQYRLDFENDLLWPDKTEFNSTGSIRYAVPPGKLKGRKSLWRIYSEAHETGFGDNTGVGSSYTEWTGFSVGPVITQSKNPVAVEGGMTITMAGTFAVRGTINSGDGRLKNDLDVGTRAIIRFSLWGKGITQDEYGVDVVDTRELMYYEGLLGTNQSAYTSFNIAGVPAATIPAGITEVYFTASSIYETGGDYGSIDYEFEAVNQALKVSYFGVSEDSDPLRIIPALPSSVNKTYKHSMSKTGVAFKNRARFNNVQPSCNLTFFGYPGIGCVVNVYNWTGSRGSLIGTYTALANERKVVSITPTGTDQIEIVKNGASNDFFIESVSNNTGHNANGYWNQVELVNMTNINDDISRISILREEGDRGNCTIDFSSDVLDPATSATLKPGKRIRVLGRHYGAGVDQEPPDWTGASNYEVVYTGTIKRVTSEYSYDDQPIIQVTAYDAHDSVEKVPAGVVFDQMIEYGPYLNVLNVPVKYNDIDWGGSSKPLPNKFIFKPSAYGDMSLADGIYTTRNTIKGFWWVNRYNEVVIKSTLPTTSIITLSDGTVTGDLDYGTFKRGSDTDSVINKISVQEFLLDRKDIVEKKLSGGDTPPLDSDYTLSKTQTAVFMNNTSINSYGEFEKSFDVVRGDGDLLNLFNGVIGTSFSSWAQAILDQRSEPTLNVSSVSIPIKSSDDIRLISALEILDRITVAFKGESQFTRIREIEHTIVPGKWFTELRFNSKSEMTYWG